LARRRLAQDDAEMRDRHRPRHQCSRAQAAITGNSPPERSDIRESQRTRISLAFIRATAITVLRRRTIAVMPTIDRAQPAAAGLSGPRRALPRIVVALPYRPGWCPSRDARSQPAWPLRSGWRRPLP